MKKRVVITGIGSLTAIGHRAEGLWHGIKGCRSKIRWLDRFDTTPYLSRCAAQVDDFIASDHFPPHRLKRLDRYAEFAVVTAQQALQDAGIVAEPENPTPEIGVSFGSALGGITTAEFHHEKFLNEGLRSISPALALQVFGGAAHANIAIFFGLRGYGTTNSNSCASGTVSVGEAFRIIRDGYAEGMLAGASETPLAPLTFGAFDTIKAMAVIPDDAAPATACRPFDTKRSGFVMAEGACTMMLESLDRAQARGAKIYAEVLGYSLNNDAYHMTSSLPTGERAIAAMRAALDEAGLKPKQIDYINAHASSTQMNDKHEASAIRKVFAKHSPAVSGTKAYYGHPLGASGAIEAAICALALRDNLVPPTINCDDPITEGSLDIVTVAPRKQELNYVMSNSFGFGGINSTIVLGKAPL